MLFFLRVEVKQTPGMSIQQFNEIWDREAQYAMEAIKAGAIKAYKVAGRRTVLVIIDVPSADDLDRAIAGLPMVQEMGWGLEVVEVLPVRLYESFAQDLRQAVSQAKR